MTFYHYSPKTNKPERCGAKSPESCLYSNGHFNKHFESPEELSQYVEETMEKDRAESGQPFFNSVSKKPKSNEQKIKELSADREETIKELHIAEEDAKKLEEKIDNVSLAERTSIEYQLDKKYSNIERLSARIKRYGDTIDSLKASTGNNKNVEQGTPGNSESTPKPKNKGNAGVSDPRAWRKRSLSTWIADDLSYPIKNAPSQEARKTLEDLQNYCRNELTTKERSTNPTTVVDRHWLRMVSRLKSEHKFPIMEKSPDVAYIANDGTMRQKPIIIEKPDTSGMTKDQTYVVNAVHASAVKLHDGTVESPEFFNVPKDNK